MGIFGTERITLGVPVRRQLPIENIPALCPDALLPGAPRSMRVTLCPRRWRWSTEQSPTIPPPTTTTSAPACAFSLTNHA